MIAQAEKRLVSLKKEGNPNANIYGVEELSGLGMIYLLKDRPAKYGLPEDPRVSTAAHIWDIIFKPIRAIVVLAMIFALWVNKSEPKKKESA